MPDYILRDIDPKLWKQFKQRAESEGRSLRWLLLEFIRRYVAKGLSEADRSTVTPQSGADHGPMQ